MDDVPLPQSYSEAPGAVVFESAEGRIVQTSASGRGPAGAAQSFYLAALPPLGWRGAAGADGLEFQRGREHLSIGFYEAAPDRSAIRFRMVSGVVP
jgi:hypothetical protein